MTLTGVWLRRRLFILMIPFFSCRALFLKRFDLKGVSVRGERVSRSSSSCCHVESTLLLCFASCPPGKWAVSLPSASLVQKARWEFSSLLSLHLVLQGDGGLHKGPSLCLVQGSEMSFQFFACQLTHEVFLQCFARAGIFSTAAASSWAEFQCLIFSTAAAASWAEFQCLIPELVRTKWKS